MVAGVCCFNFLVVQFAKLAIEPIEEAADTNEHAPLSSSCFCMHVVVVWRYRQKADKPWETLAACMELRDALAHPDGPENYPSCLPVHQDGSCNGLQHYAALGRDVEGAKLVNLIEVGDDKPADVYVFIPMDVRARRS